MQFALAPRLVKQLNSSQKPRPTSFLSCNCSANLLLHMDPYGTYHNRFEAEGQFERLETGLKMIVMTMLWQYHWPNGMKTAKIDKNGTNEGRVLAPSCPCQCGIRICARLSGRNTCVMCSVCSIEARTGMLPSGSWCTASHKLLKGFAVSQCLSENAAI